MIVPYEPKHLLEIKEQSWQSGTHTTVENAHALLKGYCAYTALCNETLRPLICAGIVEIWKDRAFCWASFDIDARPVMFEAHRRTLFELERAPFKRLEMYVIPGFAEAWRWATMLGFQIESTMEAGSPAGGDLFVFKRVKHGAATRRLA